MHRSIWLSTLLTALFAVLGIACRQEEPVGDPKTPASSPIPEPEKHEGDPKSGPKLLPSLRDAG